MGERLAMMLSEKVKEKKTREGENSRHMPEFVFQGPGGTGRQQFSTPQWGKSAVGEETRTAERNSKKTN